MSALNRLVGGSTAWSGSDAKEISLLGFIDPSQVNCLNEEDAHSLKTLLQDKVRNTEPAVFVQSDADEQLLLNIVFNQAVRVRSVVFHTADTSLGPKDVRLMVNNPSLGFDDFEDGDNSKVTQSLVISEDDLKDSTPIGLRYVRFQSVKILSIFVHSNHGAAPQTRIDAIDIFGIPIQSTKDMAELRRVEDEA